MKKVSRWRYFRRLFLFLLVILTVVYVIGAIVAARILVFNDFRGYLQTHTLDKTIPFEEVTFNSTDQPVLTLHGYWAQNKATAKVLILVHGNRTNRTAMLAWTKPLWERGYSLLLPDLRGHGLSQGDKISYGQHEQYDVLGAVNFLKSKNFKPESIGVIGSSMGGVSSLLAMGQSGDIKAGVIDSAYGNMERVLQYHLGAGILVFPGVNLAAKWLWNIDITGVKPEEAIKKLGNRRVMLIHGRDDLLVPLNEVFTLQKAGGTSVADVWLVDGVEHASAVAAKPDEYFSRILTFLDRELAN
jgi:uncharacterized protein